MIYFDTSYILKCYLPERGFGPVRALLGRQGFAACCEFGRLEFVSGLRRAAREGRLPQPAIATAISILHRDEREGVWIWLPQTPRLLELAFQAIQALPPGVSIRSGDALHLISARESGCDELFTNDRHMLAAAPHFGVRAINVIP